MVGSKLAPGIEIPIGEVGPLNKLLNWSRNMWLHAKTSLLTVGLGNYELIIHKTAWFAICELNK